jgi:hypothetical protein
MGTPLKNPVWQALSGRQKHLNAGGEPLKYFRPDISPFLAVEHWNEADKTTLYDSLPEKRSFSVMIAEKVDIPSGFEIVFSCMLYQMICKKPVVFSEHSPEIVLLGKEHVPEMLTLPNLQNPVHF